jgi:hypothetical protein
MHRKTHSHKITYRIGGSGGRVSETPDCRGEGGLWREVESVYSEGTFGFEESTFSFVNCPGCPNCPKGGRGGR